MVLDEAESVVVDVGHGGWEVLWETVIFVQQFALFHEASPPNPLIHAELHLIMKGCLVILALRLAEVGVNDEFFVGHVAEPLVEHRRVEVEPAIATATVKRVGHLLSVIVSWGVARVNF